MADNILDDVRAAAAEVEKPQETLVDPAKETPIEEPVETPQQIADRERDEQGRFKASEKPRETLKLKEKPETAPATKPIDVAPAIAAAANPPPAQTAPRQALASPPLHWKGSAKVQWQKLPQDVQLGILDDHKALQEAQAQYQPLSKAIDPHREVWMRDAGSIEAAIGQLGQFYRLYLDNPAGLIQHIARTRGIDLGQPQGQPPAQQPGIPQQAPDIASLVEQAVQQRIAPITQRFEQTENQQIEQTVQSFAADPAHPYFQDVKAHMGHLLKAGQAKDMQEAYDQATWANPVIRQQLMQAQIAEAEKAKAAEAAKASKAAAASVRGSPIPGALNGAGNPKGSVRDDVLAAFQEHGVA